MIPTTADPIAACIILDFLKREGIWSSEDLIDKIEQFINKINLNEKGTFLAKSCLDSRLFIKVELQIETIEREISEERLFLQSLSNPSNIITRFILRDYKVSQDLEVKSMIEFRCPLEISSFTLQERIKSIIDARIDAIQEIFHYSNGK
jgi:hypothetical protein